MAIEHHVYFWLKEEYKGEAERAAFEAGLEKLFEIPQVVEGLWGTPAPVMDRPVIDKSWDYALSMTFDTIAEQDIYQEDADHHVFIESFKDTWERVLVMDLQPH